MAKSSFHAEKPTKHSVEHMNRKSKVSYLVDPTSSQNEYWLNKKIPIYEEFVNLAKLSYRKWINQKMQKTQVNAMKKEAVINLNKHHTLKDVKRVMYVAGKVLGGYVPFQIAVHKDEGVFVEYVGKAKDEWSPDDYVYNSKNFKWYEKGKDGKVGQEVTNIISFRPSRDYHYNNDDKEWYIDKKFTKKADLSNKHIYYNYHAHVLYSAFDLNTGKGRSTRKDMRSLQTLVANGLKMERGERFSNTRRQTHWQRKAESDLLNDEKREHKKTKQKSNELVHENSINKNQVLLQKRMVKDLGDDFEKHQIGIEHYMTLQTEQKQLQDLLNCSDVMNIEEGIQKIKEESQKNLDELKEQKFRVEDQKIIYEKQINVLEEDIEKLSNDVYSEKYGYIKGKKTKMKLTYKDLYSINEKKIDKQKTKIEELEKQLKPTGYEIEGQSVTKVVNDYVKAMEETWKNVAEKEKNRVLELVSKVDKQDVEIEDLKKLVKSKTTIYKETSENQFKEINKLEKKVKDLEKENSLQLMDMELLDKLAFYEKDVYIDKLDDHVTEKFSYKSENEDLQKELNARESELELVNKVLKTVHKYNVPSENLSGDIREIAAKVLDEKWPKRIDEAEDLSSIAKLTDEQIENKSDTEFTKFSR